MTFETLMEKLKNSYIQNLDKKINHIQKLAQSEQWDTVRYEFHKLKGTGKTYGVPEISDLCSQVEFLLKESNHDKKELTEIALSLLSKIRTHRMDNKDFSIDLNYHFKELAKAS